MVYCRQQLILDGRLLDQPGRFFLPARFHSKPGIRKGPWILLLRVGMIEFAFDNDSGIQANLFQALGQVKIGLIAGQLLVQFLELFHQIRIETFFCIGRQGLRALPGGAGRFDLHLPARGLVEKLLDPAGYLESRVQLVPGLSGLVQALSHGLLGQGQLARRLGLMPLIPDGATRQGDHADQQRRRCAAHQRLVAAHPAPRFHRPRLRPGADRLVGQPVLDVVGQGARRVVAPVLLQSHGLQAHGFQGSRHLRVRQPGTEKFTPLHFVQHDRRVRVGEGRPAGQQAIQGRSEAVDVAGGTE